MCFKQLKNTISISGSSRVFLDSTATIFARPSDVPVPKLVLNGGLTGTEPLPHPNSFSVTQGGASGTPQDGGSLWTCCKCGLGPHNSSIQRACINCGHPGPCNFCVES